MTFAPPQTILIVEDAISLAKTYEEYLQRENYNVITEYTGKSALACLNEFRPSAVILDLHLPDINGLEILRQTHAVHPNLPIIVVTADTSPKAAIAAMNEGAFDFILKPFSAARLTVTLRNALERLALEKELLEWRQVLGQNNYHGFIGQSGPMLAVYRVIESVAVSKASVFITGESGTGKDMAAQALHAASPRRANPFIAINCGAIPHDLLESTLFGHVKGAFTGAVSDHSGAAKNANGGTLFLDEVGEMPLELQVKLLRFLQTGEITPVGSTKTETVDVRIVAATNRNPQEDVKTGRLREDLYYRLHVVPLEMPPLRDRDDDILQLADYFLQKFCNEEGKMFTTFAPEVVQLFRRYDWPGNVRQLENVMRTIIVLHEGTVVLPAMLPEKLQQLSDINTNLTPKSLEPSAGKDLRTYSVRPLWQVEKETILHTLNLTQQDVAKAAILLEVSPSTLYRKLQAWKTEARI